ncbi:MAG: WecB/TagA/CpsF family glycosyltransferase [Microgenomates group bacterium]
MKLTKKQLLDVNITVDTKEAILSDIVEYVQEGMSATKKTPLVIVTPNPEQLVEASKNKEFQLILNRADIAIPDGVGIVFGMKLIRGIKLTRISGIDLVSDLVRMANKNHLTIGFVGGQNDVAHKALIALQSSYIELHGWSEQPKAFEHAEEIMSSDMSKIVRRISDSQTRFVFVGLGAPKQELFIDILKKQLTKEHAGPVVLMSVGGSFDMLAGNTPRASGFIQRIGFEWLYRLWKEPWRFGRQTHLIDFLFLVLKARVFHT